MDEFAINPMEDDDLAQAPETPEDVAVLYTWANVHGGKYRDFSASRREYRAQQRHRQVEAQRQAELEAAREREEQAARELTAARLLEASTDKATVSAEEAEEIRRRAEERAEQERQAAQKHVRTAEELRLALEQAERELEDARRRADEQAARYAEADARWRAQQRGMADVVPGEIADPYYYAGPLEPSAFAPGKGVRSSVPQRISSERRIVDSYYRARGESGAEVEARREEARREEGLFDTGGGYVNRQGSGGKAIYREAPPRPPMEMAEIRPETLEDTLERNRPEERERTLRESESRFEEPIDDDYYDRSFGQLPSRSSAIPRGPSDRNSAPGDLHIPPRQPNPRPAAESGERRIIRSEDPAPGNTHALDESLRSRRRESAADVLTRTARRPRSSGEYEGYSDRSRRDVAPEPRDAQNDTAAPEPRHSYTAEESAARRDASRLPERGESHDRAGFEERTRSARTHYDDRPQVPAAAAPVRTPREESAGRDERPAWLIRDGRGGERAADAQVRETRGGETEGRQERDAFEEFLARSIDAAPRSIEDRPARSSYMERDDHREVSADTRNEFAGEGSRDDVAERRRESRRMRASADLTREMPSIRADLSDSQTVRAADGGLNLRPLRERPPVDKLPPLRDLPPMRDLPPLRDRSAYHEGSDEAPAARNVSREAAAPQDIEQYPASPVSADRVNAPSRVAPEPTWPRVERRRYERSSGSRGVAQHLDSSREYRVAARAAEAEEKSDRTRSQSARREVELREDFRNDAQAASRAEVVTRGRESRPAPMPSPAGTPAGTTRPGSAPAASESDTLQQSRERVAARWFALKGLMGPNTEPTPDIPPPTRTSRETTAPMLSVVALSGGVGKTSLVATLGRALSSVGEKVLLADTTAHGLLPYYFGARELRPDVVRTFSPPPGSSDATVYMVNYETDRLAADEAGQANLVEEITHHSKGTQRVLLDLNGSSAWLARRLARLNSSVLVPIAPDMNSVLSIQAVERFFAGTQDGEGRPVSPYYVLNQFDASLPLHLDVREVLRQQLGNRLLPVMIRRSQSVSEALAEGMTVIDYAPESPVTEDYIHLAEWVRNLAAPASVGLRSIRWSER